MSDSPENRPNGRYFDREFGAEAVRIHAGDCFFTAEGTAVSTLLGSCVSVCLYDPARRIGGMNHFMLPEQLSGKRGAARNCSGNCSAHCCARYGNCSMSQLLAGLKRLGAHPGTLQAKLFGGGRMMRASVDIGLMNAQFALRYLKTAGIPVVASDLGGCRPRKIIFFPATGRAFVKPGRGNPSGN